VLGLTGGLGTDFGVHAAGVGGTLEQVVDAIFNTSDWIDDAPRALDDLHRGRITRGVILMEAWPCRAP